MRIFLKQLKENLHTFLFNTINKNTAANNTLSYTKKLNE